MKITLEANKNKTDFLPIRGGTIIIYPTSPKVKGLKLVLFNANGTIRTIQLENISLPFSRLTDGYASYYFEYDLSDNQQSVNVEFQ